MHNDQYYCDFIVNTHFLTQTTKKNYLKRIQTIQSEIFPHSIEEIINDPKGFHQALQSYSIKTKGRLGQTLGQHTLDAYYASIIALFIYNQKLRESNPELYLKWKEFHENVRKPINDKYKSNEPTERQKQAYVDFDDIVAIRDRLPKGSQERLLLMMYTEIPPVRSDYYKTQIVKTIDDANDDNFIVLDNKHPYIVLKKYKTSKKYGVIYIDIPNTLYQEILSSLKKNPREYLFVSTRTHKAYDQEGTFNRWANRKLKSIFGKKNFSISMLRHIYISRRDLKLEEKSGLEQEQIAQLMGHSIEQQRKYLWHTWLKQKDM